MTPDLCVHCHHSIQAHAGRPHGENDACTATVRGKRCRCPRMVRLVTLTQGHGTIGQQSKPSKRGGQP